MTILSISTTCLAVFPLVISRVASALEHFPLISSSVVLLVLYRRPQLYFNVLHLTSSEQRLGYLRGSDLHKANK